MAQIPRFPDLWLKIRSHDLMKMTTLTALLICISLSNAVAKPHSFSSLLLDQLKRVKAGAESYLNETGLPYQPSPDYPYWNFLPQFVGAVIPGGPSLKWASPCFGSNVATASYTSSGVDISVTSSAPTQFRCEDEYMTLFTGAVQWFNGVKGSGSASSSWSLPYPSDGLSQAEQWDLSSKGVRVLRYLLPKAETLSNMLLTLTTFVPEGLPDVPDKYAAMGVSFMGDYAGIKVTPRDPLLNRTPEEAEVSSGDSFYLMRFDGLNPLLAWAMGSSTGHVATALWLDGALFVCESTISSAYWPTDHIQRTPYRTWIQQVTAADFQVVWVRLDEAARRQFNESAAAAFFLANEGMDYGFKTLLWGWLDTESANFPCLPPDFSSNCLQWALLEPFIAHVDRLLPEVGDMLWNAGLAKRLGTASTRTAELYEEAGRQGVSTAALLTVPEQDSWLYNTTRYDEPAEGRAMVCCVFVCSTWKAAGVFGDLAEDINCAEQTNWDDYALSIHAAGYEQIVGSYSLDLNDFRSKAPYAHIAEHCPSLPPAYAKPADC